MDLPKNESSFYFKHEGELTGRSYEGDFTCKCLLTVGDKRILEIEKSQLTVDLSNPTGNLSAIGTVVANLRVRLIVAPDWFKQAILSLDILDEEVFFELYGKCIGAETEWIKSLKKEVVEKEVAEKEIAEGN